MLDRAAFVQISSFPQPWMIELFRGLEWCISSFEPTSVFLPRHNAFLTLAWRSIPESEVYIGRSYEKHDDAITWFYLSNLHQGRVTSGRACTASHQALKIQGHALTYDHEGVRGAHTGSSRGDEHSCNVLG